MQVKTLQNEDEIARFVEIVKAEGCRSYLEIGSKFGGSLWRVGSEMPAGSKIVSVDMPAGTRVWPESRASLSNVVEKLKGKGQDAQIIWGDSTASDVIAKVNAIGPFDCVFIDGNHTMPFVRKDFANYKNGAKLVAFHDIAWKRPKDFSGIRIDVPEFWQETKGHYRHEEIRRESKDNGIGVLWL